LHADYGFIWLHLPEETQLILEHIGEHLHDTLEHPNAALNFESTPEQLLTRIHCLEFLTTYPFSYKLLLLTNICFLQIEPFEKLFKRHDHGHSDLFLGSYLLFF